MVTKRLDALNNIIENKAKKEQGPIIITVQTETGLDILGKYFLQIRKAVDKNIAFYPFIVIPKKRVSQIKSIDKKPDNNQSDNGY